MKGSILILGARSDIARAIAHRFAENGYKIQLAARGIKELSSDRTDLKIRYGIAVSTHEFDALKTKSHTQFVKSLPELPEIAICVVGYMGDQIESEHNVEASVHVMRSNYEGPASVLAELAIKFEERGSGTLVGVSSVAGERGRATNYVYGSAKAGFTAFLSGLRNRLAKKGIHVVTVLPGFVNTKMTEGMDLPKLLTSSPRDLAKVVYRASLNSSDVVYSKKVWFFLMLLIRLIPERLFKKMKI